MGNDTYKAVYCNESVKFIESESGAKAFSELKKFEAAYGKIIYVCLVDKNNSEIKTVYSNNNLLYKVASNK